MQACLKPSERPACNEITPLSPCVQEMERFKVLEKETKTKAYSKEGLSQLQDDYDPTNDPAYPTLQWIEAKEAELQEQMETYNENLAEATRKKRGEQETHWNKWIDRHAWHLQQLEKTRDRLNEGSIPHAIVDELKEDIEYYIESNQDPDFYEDELLYVC